MYVLAVVHCYICVLILLYVPSYYSIGVIISLQGCHVGVDEDLVHMHVLRYHCYICVLILPHMCPHINIYYCRGIRVGCV
jgi:hypothetical protein